MEPRRESDPMNMLGLVLLMCAGSLAAIAIIVACIAWL